MILLERPERARWWKADHRIPAPGLKSQTSRFMRAFSGWVWRSSGTNFRLEVQAGRWPVS
jgi:hypothetical protein